MSGIVAWFMGTKVGRGIAFGVAFAALLAVAYWRIFTSGRKAERTVQDQQSIRNHQSREEIHNDIASRSDDQRRRDLSRWVQPD